MIIAQPTGAGAGMIYTTEDFKADLEKEYAENEAVWGGVDAVKNQKILYLGTDDYPGTTGLRHFQVLRIPDGKPSEFVMGRIHGKG